MKPQVMFIFKTTHTPLFLFYLFINLNVTSEYHREIKIWRLFLLSFFSIYCMCCPVTPLYNPDRFNWRLCVFDCHFIESVQHRRGLNLWLIFFPSFLYSNLCIHNNDIYIQSGPLWSLSIFILIDWMIDWLKKVSLVVRFSIGYGVKQYP